MTSIKICFIVKRSVADKQAAMAKKDSCCPRRT